MRLHLLTPPALVTVRERGEDRRALLLATRGERSYVQVCRGVGANHLMWVGSGQVNRSPGLR